MTCDKIEGGQRLFLKLMLSNGLTHGLVERCVERKGKIYDLYFTVYALVEFAITLIKICVRKIVGCKGDGQINQC